MLVWEDKTPIILSNGIAIMPMGRLSVVPTRNGEEELRQPNPMRWTAFVPRLAQQDCSASLQLAVEDQKNKNSAWRQKPFDEPRHYDEGYREVLQESGSVPTLGPPAALFFNDKVGVLDVGDVCSSTRCH